MPPVGILVFGLVTGSLAGLNSVGFVLLWRTSRVINLAQPGLGLVGGVLTGMLVVAGGWGFWWAVPIGMLVGATLSVLAERTVLSRLQEVPRSVLLVATVGLAQIFSGMYSAIPFIFGGRLPTYTIDLGEWSKIFIDPVLLLGPHILALLALPMVTGLVHLFMTRSRVGVAALALGQDQERARALGVPAGLVRTVVWGIAGAIGSVSGILSIPVLGFGLEGGALTPTVLLLAFAPAVLAGLRSIWAAAAASLALGVLFQSAIWITDGAGAADLVLVAAIVLALIVRKGRVGREAVAARASSWEAASTVRPLPWSIASSNIVFIAAVALAAAAAIAVVVPALTLSPSDRVLYGTAAAFALGAMGVTTAWMFAGELPLGHWGFAGIGAAIAVVTPGHWGVKTLVAAVAIGLINALLAAVTRTHASLSYAVIGLAAAAVAPVALSAGAVGRGVIRADTRMVCAAAGLLALGAAVLIGRLRSSTLGARMVAARDDPARAPWFGVDPLRTRIYGLALSGLMVGAAGALYVASQPAGLAPGSFRPERSLALLAIAVVGGLGSPTGALIAAAALTAAERLFSPPWNGLTSGLGVVLVVLFLPAGISRGIEQVRDLFVRVAVRRGERARGLEAEA